MIEEKFNVTGMSCAACSSRVEKAVKKLDGAEDVSVNLLTGTMRLNRDDNKISDADIVRAVEKAGYGAAVDGPDQRGGQVSNARTGGASDAALDDAANMKLRLIWSVVFWLPLMAVAMGHMVVGHGIMGGPLTIALVQVLLLIPIVALNFKYFRNGIPSLLRGGPNMDSLIAVGTLAAILYGTFSIFMMTRGYEIGNMELIHKYSSQVYFESAGTILTLITVGKYLESRSKGKTSQAIEKLMELAPATANVERDGVEVTISADELRVGDILVVRPGERIAADGRIEKGNTTTDESAITGESMPVEKSAGSRVVSGTINKTGFIKVICDKVGSDSTINQIIKLVDEASASKAPIARLADKIAGVFVPVVMLIALATAVIWLVAGATLGFALSTAIAVLVISCPCALGLATPVAIMVGTGKGAENGILIKSGQALETAHSIDTVVMDKTGTITEGRPKVTDVLTFGIDQSRLLSMAAAMETGSEHPLAEAVCTFAREQKMAPAEVESFEAVFGKGIKAVLGGLQYFAGNAAMMTDAGVDPDDESLQKADDLAGEGKTPLIFAQDNKVIGMIAVADTEKATSKEAIDDFRKLGIDVVMLTGDNQRTANAIGKRLGITKAIAGVLPQDKEKQVAALQAEGHKVAMIGDGVNDAPALARADLGIAIGAGTDVAIESADAVLMRSDLLDAVTAIRLSRAVMKNIKENLFWAFFYNIICIPVAAGVLYPALGILLSPMIGAAAMSLSSVCVVGNALRLKRFKTDRHEADGENIVIQEDNSMNYEFKIEGMMCQMCQKHMTEALNKMDGVEATIDLENGLAHVKAEKSVSEAEFAAVTEEAGYKLTGYKEG
ncbi:heavy metal translocating P-type ATPase [Aminicella lysinilytica]|uniref:Copper-exporting P-type ATPase n=1 Tax=Aminicella lysinilytica TaxID=433323 RepID=A0A4R6QCC0_9FIRM|nr:heavy metal translocating P-type ATPase [Aminicella lysinilytica]TDP59787.1 Cu+-exporting ATPase [Aminicella lysinilytica]